MSLAGAVGGTLVLPEKFDPRDILRLIAEHDAEVVALVPVMLRRILDLPARQRTPKPEGLRAVLVSGSAMSPELRAETQELFGEVLYDLYGSTEAGGSPWPPRRTSRPTPARRGGRSEGWRSRCSTTTETASTPAGPGRCTSGATRCSRGTSPGSRRRNGRASCRWASSASADGFSSRGAPTTWSWSAARTSTRPRSSA